MRIWCVYEPKKKMTTTRTRQTVQWVIPSFSKAGTELRSNRFEFANRHWIMLVFPHGRDKESSGFVSVYLRLDEKVLPATAIVLRSKISLRSGGRSLSPLTTETFTAESLGARNEDKNIYPSCGYDKFVKRDRRFEESMVDDTVTMEVVMESEPFAPLKPPGLHRRLATLHHHAQLLQTGEHSDVTLVVENQEFRAHKAILAAGSPVFRGMFAHGMQEALTNKVVMDDMSADTFRLVLQYVTCVFFLRAHAVSC